MEFGYCLFLSLAETSATFCGLKHLFLSHLIDFIGFKRKCQINHFVAITLFIDMHTLIFLTTNLNLYLTLQQFVPWDRDVPSRSVGETYRGFMGRINVTFWSQALGYTDGSCFFRKSPCVPWWRFVPHRSSSSSMDNLMR